MSDVSRDRLGQWAVESESGVAGDLSGRDRMKSGRHNKVRNCENFEYCGKLQGNFVRRFKESHEKKENVNKYFEKISSFVL